MADDKAPDMKGTPEQEERRNPLAAQGLKRQVKRRSLSRKSLLLLALAGVIAAVGVVALALFVFVPKPEELPPPTESVDKSIVSGKLRDDVQEVIVATANETLSVIKDGEMFVSRENPDVKLDQSLGSDLFYAAASLSWNDLVDPAPSDLALYGLEKPRSRVTCIYKDGTKREFLLGDALSVGSLYYLKEAGQPTVYTVWINVGQSFSRTLATMRDTLLPKPDPETLRHVLVEQKGKESIELVYDVSKDSLTLAVWKLKQPYEWDADWEKSDAYTRLTPVFAVREFVDDTSDPAKLETYGLKDPVARVAVEDEQGVGYDVLIGGAKDEYSVYAMEKGKTAVFTMDKSKVGFLDTKPVALIDRFSHLIKIDMINGYTLTKQDGTKVEFTIERTAAFNDKGEREKDAGGNPVFNEKFFVDGKELEDNLFKKFYQSVLGLLIDEERKQEPSSETPVLTVAFHTSAQGDVVAKYLPYDRDYYALDRDGSRLFLLDQQRIAAVYADLDALQAGTFNPGN